MRPQTISWYRFESVGKPEHTLTGQAPIREILLTLSRWLLQVYMGSKVRIILARTEAELCDSKRGKDLEEMQSELADLLDSQVES